MMTPDEGADVMTPEERDAMRAELIAMQAQELAKPQPTAASKRGSRVKPATTTPTRTARDIARNVGAVNPNSIRQTVIAELLAGKSTADITATLKAKFPASQAAAKPSIHIGYYRSQLRKKGLLPSAK